MNDCAAPRHDTEPCSAEPHSWLCGNCTRYLRSDLRRLPALYRRLEELADPRTTSIGAHGDGTGLPYHDAAYERRTQIRRDLAWWTTDLAERRGWETPARDSVPAMAGWITAQVKWAAYRADTPSHNTPWCTDLAATMNDNRSGAAAIIDPMPRAEIPIPADCNYCPRCGHTMCLYAVVYQSAGDRRPSMVTCGNCAHEWDTMEWMRLGKTIIAWRDAQRKAAA